MFLVRRGGLRISTASTHAQSQTFLTGIMGNLLGKSDSKAAGPGLVDSPENAAEAHNKACFGAGCYWGTEKYFVKDFVKKNPGVTVKGAVGFMGPPGCKKNPGYREVCSGTTGHVEVYDMEFSPAGPETFESLCRFFYQFHDPTTMNRQGNDAGTQYASVIYCYSDEQVAIAKKVSEELQGHVSAGKVSCFSNDEVSTDIRRATTFYKAQEDHQRYLEENPGGYCNHRMRFKEWPSAPSKL